MGRVSARDELDQAYARRRFRPRYPFVLTATEIGVFLSHRAAWRRIVDENLDFAFVFEDDAQIDPAQFAALIEFVTAERAAWDYVLLPAKPIERGRRSRVAALLLCCGPTRRRSERSGRSFRAPPPSAFSIALCPSTARSTRSCR